MDVDGLDPPGTDDVSAGRDGSDVGGGGGGGEVAISSSGGNGGSVRPPIDSSGGGAIPGKMGIPPKSCGVGRSIIGGWKKSLGSTP